MYSAKKLVKRIPFFYGWVAIAIAGLGYFFTGPGQTYSFSLFIDHFIEDFGWSRVLVNSLYSIASLISGLSMFLVGRYVDKKGAKRVMLIAALLLAASMFWFSFLSSTFMLFVGFLIGRFSGQSSLMLATGTVAPRWFVKKRGLAIMLVSLGGTAGNMVFPKLNAYLIETLGWQTAFGALGIFVLVVFVPLCAIFMINKPEDVGEHPDGIADVDHEEEHLEEVEKDHATSLTQGETLRTVVFWLMFVSATQYSMIGTGIGLNYVSIFNAGGIADLNFITTMMSLAPLIGLAAMLTSGLYINKLKKPQILLAVISVMIAISFVVLANLSSRAGAIVYMILNGLTMSMFFLMHDVIKPYMFGRRFIGSVSGVFLVAWSGGSALGPVLFGLAFEMFGGYKEILMVLALLPFVTGVLLLFIKRPKKRRGNL
ncbi:MAG: MFS transporter [Clostridia bacterium]|nr:MFS transporter [Clostridia bacterium]MBT7121866.1 MFS transporter [Clostridia bacterium]